MLATIITVTAQPIHWQNGKDSRISALVEIMCTKKAPTSNATPRKDITTVATRTTMDRAKQEVMRYAIRASTP